MPPHSAPPPRAPPRPRPLHRPLREPGSCSGAAERAAGPGQCARGARDVRLGGPQRARTLGRARGGDPSRTIGRAPGGGLARSLALARVPRPPARRRDHEEVLSNAQVGGRRRQRSGGWRGRRGRSRLQLWQLVRGGPGVRGRPLPGHPGGVAGRRYGRLGRLGQAGEGGLGCGGGSPDPRPLLSSPPRLTLLPASASFAVPAGALEE